MPKECFLKIILLIVSPVHMLCQEARASVRFPLLVNQAKRNGIYDGAHQAALLLDYIQPNPNWIYPKLL